MGGPGPRRRPSRRAVRDLKDAQADDGAIPVVVPTPGWGTTADPCWSTAYLLIAWNLFEYYADADLLDEHYTAFRTYVDHLHATCRPTGWIWPDFSYADWLAPGHKFAPEGPKLAASAFVYLATRRLADIAEVLRRHDDAARYAQTAGEIGLAFNRAFFDAASATYRSAPGEAYRQTSNVLPLAFGLVPADAIPAVVQHLVHDIVEVRDGHLNTGALGAKYLLPVLTEHGRADVAVTVAGQRTYPGWGYWKEQGSRTLWEAWDPNARSHDHYFLGSVDRWLCEHVAGLRPSGPGFETIEVKPLVDQRITAASERYRSVRGEIAVAWQRSSAGLELDLTLPVGATALVHVPAGEGDLVTEAGRPIDASPGRGYASVSVASGSYHFQSTPGAASGSPVA